jgi:diguanylate cyclase (GGDEF)-like protein
MRPGSLIRRLDPWCAALLAAGTALAVAGALAPGAMAATQAPRLVDAAAHGVGAWLCVRVARAGGGRPRLCWSAFAAWLGLWGAATLAWAIANLLSWEVPRASVLDVVWLASYVPLLVAVMLVHRALEPGFAGWGSVIDALALACGIALIGWELVLGPSADADGLGLAGVVVPAAYPTLDLLAICLVAWLILRRGARPPWLGILLGALVAQLIGDVGYVHASAVDDHAVLFASEGLWVVAVAGFAAMAAARRAGPPLIATPRPGPAPAWTQLLPLPVALIAGVAAILTPDSPAILMVAVIAQILVVARLVGAVMRAERLARENARLSVTDALTGAHNRRFLDAELGMELGRARRTGRPLSVIALDLDRFKPVNDELGHRTGDRLLAVCARTMQASLRPGDRLCRSGGDEFTVLAPETDAAQALALAGRLVAAVRLAGEEHAPGIGVSASAGVASVPHHPADAEVLLAAADRALYRAKREGRGRALVAEPA